VSVRARPADLEPSPFVTLVRRRNVEKVDSIAVSVVNPEGAAPFKRVLLEEELDFCSSGGTST